MSPQDERALRTTRTRTVVLATIAATAAVMMFAVTIAGAMTGDSSNDAAVDTTVAPHHSETKYPGAHAMIGDEVPAPGKEGDLTKLTEPPEWEPPLAKGEARTVDIVARDETIEVAKGVFFNAWTFNGTVPGPIIRVTEGDLVRINFKNDSPHPHTIHTHGIHAENQDGVFEVVDPGETFTYEFVATPAAHHVFHCHVAPLKKHVSKGMYGTFIVDPKKKPEPAKELVMVMNGFDTDGDGENNFYTVNGKAFFFAKYPIRVKRNELVRIYLSNMTEFDAINSFHLHGNFFTYYPVTKSNPGEFTDIITLGQGDRGILEVRFPNTGRFMFHAHQAEFAELGWMGYFEVTP